MTPSSLPGADPLDPLALALEEADGLALGLRLLRDRLALALGRTLALFTEREGWKEHGYARQGDYAREKLGRSSRWVRDMARLGIAVERYPRLGAALTGEDGGIPLGVAATQEIAAIAEAEAKLPAEARQSADLGAWMQTWIERARNVCLRQLRADGASARADAQREAPALSREKLSFGYEGQPSAPREEGEPRDGAREKTRRYTLQLGVPPEAAAAFEETLDLHRAVCGGEVTVSSFVEALVAEYHAGPGPAGQGVEGSGTVAGVVQGGGQDARRPGGAPHSEGLCSAAAGGQDARRPEADGDLDLDDQLWMTLQQHPQERAAERETRLAEACDHWKQWPQGDQAVASRIGGHEQARALLVEIGKLVDEAARGVGPETDPEKRARARVFVAPPGADALTLHRRIRRLMGADRRIEIVLGELLASMADRRAWGRWHPAPWRFDNIAHYAEERLGISRSRAWQLVRVARRLRRFPRLRRAYQSGKASLEAVVLVLRVLGRGPVDEGLERRWTERACRSTIKRLRDEVRELRRGPLPAAPGATPPEPLTDDAWFRSVARPPGCTSRQHLEDHHIRYRSRGGGDEPANRTTLYAFHHLRGEHGGLMQVTGSAPTSLDFRLGAPDFDSETFHSELRPEF